MFEAVFFGAGKYGKKEYKEIPITNPCGHSANFTQYTLFGQNDAEQRTFAGLAVGLDIALVIIDYLFYYGQADPGTLVVGRVKPLEDPEYLLAEPLVEPDPVVPYTDRKIVGRPDMKL